MGASSPTQPSRAGIHGVARPRGECITLARGGLSVFGSAGTDMISSRDALGTAFCIGKPEAPL